MHPDYVVGLIIAFAAWFGGVILFHLMLLFDYTLHKHHGWNMPWKTDPVKRRKFKMVAWFWPAVFVWMILHWCFSMFVNFCEMMGMLYLKKNG